MRIILALFIAVARSEIHSADLSAGSTQEKEKVVCAGGNCDRVETDVGLNILQVHTAQKKGTDQEDSGNDCASDSDCWPGWTCRSDQKIGSYKNRDLRCRCGDKTEIRCPTGSTCGSTGCFVPIPAGADYSFFHDGHCAGGWINANTRQDTMTSCGLKCRNQAGCNYFAFDNEKAGTNCALYNEAGGCPDDYRFRGYNAFRMDAGVNRRRALNHHPFYRLLMQEPTRKKKSDLEQANMVGA